jgi:HD-GYP domain-containing protein (c-di-GMP phosphodiesterase class II)
MVLLWHPSMPAILVWGKCREVLTGELPPGITTDEVSTLAELQAKLEPGVGMLVLAESGRLEAEREALADWMKAGGRDKVVLLCACETPDEVLERFPFVDDAFARPISAARLRHRVLREADIITERRALRQLEAAFSQKNHELQALNRVGIALSAERDIDKLLPLILSKSREITGADAGTLYMVEKPAQEGGDTTLWFRLAQNDSISVHKFEKTEVKEPSIAGYAARAGKVMHVPDAYNVPPDSPFRIGRKFDEESGYRTKSILVVPMRDHEDKVIGVVQLINKKIDPKQVLRPISLVDQLVIPFTSLDEELLTTLASQAAIAIENTNLLQDIKRLFFSFVHASVTAIESRDPTTSGHSGRVADLTVAMAEKVDSLDSGPFKDLCFSRDQIQEVRYASLLHDFGKVGVREKVLIKGKKLYVGELLLVRSRFAYVKRSIEAEHLRAKLEQVASGRSTADLLAEMDREHEARQREVDGVLGMILQANEPSILEEDNFRALMDMPKRTFADIDGNRQPFLTPNELSALSIRRGSLSEKERREIESHVTHTFRFLTQIPWTGEYRNVPQIAYAHHEKMDGTGYPRRLAGADIPVQSRMMTISDIFDALVAWDRPYKKSVPVERALDILKEEAGQGKLDKELLAIFIEAKIYEVTIRKTGAGAEIARP